MRLLLLCSSHPPELRSGCDSAINPGYGVRKWLDPIILAGCEGPGCSAVALWQSGSALRDSQEVTMWHFYILHISMKCHLQNDVLHAQAGGEKDDLCFNMSTQSHWWLLFALVRYCCIFFIIAVQFIWLHLIVLALVKAVIHLWHWAHEPENV